MLCFLALCRLVLPCVVVVLPYFVLPCAALCWFVNCVVLSYNLDFSCFVLSCHVLTFLGFVMFSAASLVWNHSCDQSTHVFLGMSLSFKTRPTTGGVGGVHARGRPRPGGRGAYERKVKRK